MITAFIPARGGSKGIPRKNLANLCGKPLIAWTIEQAMAAEHVSRVVVSSDCENIGSVAMACGAEWVPRPSSISGDDASTESAIAHWLMDEPVSPQLVVLLQPTSPIRQPGTIDAAIAYYRQCGCDSLFSARRVEGFIWTEHVGHVRPHYDVEDRKRRQDLDEATVEENGSLYIFRPSVFHRTATRLGGKVAAFLMDPLDSFQVDEPSDLDLMRALIPLRLGKGVPSGSSV